MFAKKANVFPLLFVLPYASFAKPMPCFYEKIQTSPLNSQYLKTKRCGSRFNSFYNCLHVCSGYGIVSYIYFCGVIIRTH